MGSNPSDFKGCGDDCPVEQVSWVDAQEFIQRLNRKEGEKGYRLPTETQWEYACRAGSKGRYCFGDEQTQLGEYAWYWNNSDNKTHPVGQKKPNAWGLFDMHGNVYEWCQDRHRDYPTSHVTDPIGPESSEPFRMLRSCSFHCGAKDLRSANRGDYRENERLFSIGFRLARDP